MLKITFFLLLNLLIFFAYYCFTIKLGIKRFSERLLNSALLSIAQIIFTELFLGIIAFLYLPALLALNISISSYLILRSLNKSTKILSSIKNDLRQLEFTVREIINLPNIFLFILFILLSMWMTLASNILPPRGVDDHSYHLTPIIEYINNHKIFLLPIKITDVFAFPQNGELLFLWPAIFFKDYTFLCLIQFIIALFGVLTTYVLGRIMGLKPSIAFFISIQFLFSPLVLAQAGCNYIDIIVATFILLTLYSAIVFYLREEIIYLYLCAISSGILLGMKYSAILFLPCLQIPILIPLFKRHRKHILPYILCTFLFGGFWYMRNLLVLGSPIYPINPISRDLTIFVAAKESHPFTFFLEIPKKIYYLLFKDIGLGSLHGGLGITFWGIALPCWFAAFWQSFIADRTQKFIQMIVWIQLGVGFLLLFLTPIEYLYLSARFAIIVIPIALLAMGKFLQMLEENRINYSKIIKFGCCVFSLLSLIIMASFRIPSYAVNIPIESILAKKNVSKLFYLQLLSYKDSSLFYCWEVLDLITKNTSGLTVYIAPNNWFYWTAPYYGSKFQNRIWNLLPDDKRSTPPDAFVYGRANSWTLNKKYELSQIVFDPQYQMILNADSHWLFVKKDFANSAETIDLLTELYSNYFSYIISATTEIKSILQEGIPVVSSDQLFQPLKYYELTGQIKNPVYSVPAGFEEEFIRSQKWQKFYTIHSPIKGFNHKKVFEKTIPGTNFTIFENTL